MIVSMVRKLKDCNHILNVEKMNCFGSRSYTKGEESKFCRHTECGGHCNDNSGSASNGEGEDDEDGDTDKDTDSDENNSQGSGDEEEDQAEKLRVVWKSSSPPTKEVAWLHL